jgi:hypothetical protein
LAGRTCWVETGHKGDRTCAGARQASRAGGIEIGRLCRWTVSARSPSRRFSPKRGARCAKERRPVRLVGRTSHCKNTVFPNPERRGPRVIPNLRRSSALSAGAPCCTRASRLTLNRVARERGVKWRTPNSFRRDGSEAGLVRGSITGADASGMTRAPKSWRGAQWRVNPAGFRPAPIQ